MKVLTSLYVLRTIFFKVNPDIFSLVLQYSNKIQHIFEPEKSQVLYAFRSSRSYIFLEQT